MTDESIPPEPTDPAEPADADARRTGAPWDPEGTELAQALLGRARAGQGGNRSGPSRRRSSATSRPVRGSGSGWSSPDRDERDPKPLDDAVRRLVGEYGWEQELAVHGAVARWSLIVGDEIAAHVRPEQYAEGELTVRAESTAWATQVRLLAPDLVRRLNQELGESVVRRVVVQGPHAPSWRKGPRSVPGRGPRDTYG